MNEQSPVNIDLNELEKVINRIYPGLTMYVRDADLPDAVAEKYLPGLIIKERGFTDASCRVMGMVTSHRFAILSNHMADFRSFEHGTNWGLFVAQSGSHFKVLGQHVCGGKTMILLLHLPDDETWRLFENISINMDEQIVDSCIKRFEQKVAAPPIPELAGQDWLDRCKFPLGMNDNGELFELD